ncbi:MAG: hypothetical protein Q4D98_07885 [Planctomycetia bacterium]|nr:hypothetical protein [Planctomycetia bacterium]
MFEVFMLYEVNPTTWFYLATLMIVGIFFKFRRVWSVRNFDLAILLLLAPGLLMVAYGFGRGYAWLFTVEFLLLVRMMCDPMMVRKPLLDVNLSKGGLMFSCISLMVFLIAGTFLTQWSNPSSPQTATIQHLLTTQLNERVLQTPTSVESGGETVAIPPLTHGPGLPVFMRFADQPRQFLQEELRLLKGSNIAQEILAAKQTFQPMPMGIFCATQLVVILGQLAIVVGMILIGWLHFENFATGVAAATLYLLLPYSAQIPARIDHIVPAALLIWAVFSYRLPSLSGMLVGMSAAFSFYPLFLIPLWCSFYWTRGLYRFLLTCLTTAGILLLSNFLLAGGDLEGFLTEYFCVANPLYMWPLEGYWSAMRMPITAIYVILMMILFFWPAQKNLGTLLANSATLMLGAQFCVPFQSGLYMAWFLPFAILVIFRPNLEDRTAQRALMFRKRPPRTVSQEF